MEATWKFFTIDEMSVLGRRAAEEKLSAIGCSEEVGRGVGRGGTDNGVVG